MNKKAIIGVLIFSLSTAFPATLQVPEEYTTIHMAIEAASHGDRIVVAPGIYAEGIDFSGKNIVLTSQDPNDPETVNRTILKPGLIEQISGRSVVYTTSGPVVQFTQGETSDAVLTGFTITEGVGKAFKSDGLDYLYGAGIYCDRASPKIIGNTITMNGSLNYQKGYTVGGGICCANSEALIIGNLIAGNYAAEVGGILAVGGQIIIARNHIVGNVALIGGGCAFNQGLVACNVIEKNEASQGGGIFLFGTGTLIHNTIVSNSAEMGGNLSAYSLLYGSKLCQVTNNIIASAKRGGGIIWVDDGEGLSDPRMFQFNNIWQGNKDEAFQKLLWSDQDGTWLTPLDVIWDTYDNMYAEPGFVDEMNGDYHLRPDSPCINAGDPQYDPLAGEDDMDGEDRVYSWRTDIGADEFVGYIWPVAHAGEDQHVPGPNILITLDGSQSRIHDPFTIPGFHWRQISGPTVELTGTDMAQAQFLPAVDGTYGFELVVSDDQQDSRPDTVTIAVGFVQTYADRVEWTFSDQGNGHLYQPVRCSKSVIWEDANTLSMQAGGHLATLTSAAENLFVFDVTNHMDLYWTAISCVGRRGPWLGAYQIAGSQEPAKGWTWITGEAFEYTAWYPDQPSGIYRGKNEDRLIFFHKKGITGPTWNDEASDLGHVSYVIEYDPVDWQAEWGVSMEGGNVEASNFGYRGDGYLVLDNSTSPTGRVSVQWDIPFGPTGPRQVLIRYAQNTGESIELLLEINGMVLTESLVLPDTSGWDQWAVVSVPVYFQPGTNRLILSTMQPESKLNLDQLTFVDENTNLALDKRINFSDHVGKKNAVYAIDGNHHSIWKAEDFPKWIEIDLENDYSIRRTQLIWNDDSIYHYQIEVKSSLDSEYTCVVDATQNMKPGTFWAPLVDDINPVPARYVQLTVLGKLEGSSNPDAMDLVEFRINATIDTPLQ